ncbi:polyphosphate kinase 1 [Faecalibacterium prausnitzii]|uniref:polyphosphate kinase 1 n=1 Tax=Faecalibacterium prausnitzii TaxID=853 RepID=UPI00290D2B2F|nr:polyphosphate kinase 1 [Faecalibacterium prausnitzii]MDU8666605.1 polyphosphate kinase 1 [Faecalibacterium prausnitzii]
MSEESIFINRELSWLDFNRRVLVLGKDKNVPLAEQLKFLAIYGSNLDEFFMVRVGSLQERANLMRGKKEKRENKTNMTAEEQLAAIMPKTAQLQEDCDKYYAKALENLAACGYRKVDFDKLSKEDEHFWKKYFQSELFPILSPQIVDSRHPFPFLRNKEIYLGVLLHEKHTSEHTLGIVPISSQMERMHFVRKDNETCFALTEELVLHYAALIFGKENVQEKCLFRVTRNADIDVKEGMMDHDIDYREIMADLLKRRRKLAAVRLQVIPAAPQVAQLLCSRLELTHKRVFVQKSPLDLSFFYKLTSRMESDGHLELFYMPARPMLPPQDYDLAAEVEKHDVLLSYPYQSIRPFIAMLKKAAQDPDVISIKMTLYRMARESQIVQALVEAAENGKEVVALVELRARFDEQNNIDWSKHLEEAGCTVIYGFDDYKVHSKLTLITKKSAHGYSYITQIGTGNYNEKTSELYTDYSFITADLGIGEEASNVFQNLAVQKLTEESEKMLVAPLRFKSVLLDEMDRVINAARLGRPASMILKNNSISDRDIILKLEEASCAGVRIDMIVRGICCVRAGVPGKTENLHIRSLVGRYLEHGRIYSFYDGVNTRIYIASGDFLTRNTECRVEVGVRVEDPVLKEKLDSILRLQLSDNVNAREMQPDGSYQKVKPAPGEPLVNSQMGMYDLLRDDWTARDKAPAPASVAETPKPQPVKAPEKPAAPAKAAPQPARPAEPEKQPVQPEKAAPAPMPIVVTESRPRRTGLLSRLLEHFLK